MVVTYRVALGAAPAWQLISSALCMAVVIWALIRVAGRLYSGALLHFGSRIPLRDLWHSTRRDQHEGTLLKETPWHHTSVAAMPPNSPSDLGRRGPALDAQRHGGPPYDADENS
jgi:hypothetical protein